MIVFVAVGPIVMAVEAMVTAVAGTMATLRCTASGDPVPVQSWSRAGAEIVDPRIEERSNGSVLVIGEVREEDQGSYHCHASNTAGDVNATVQLNVISKSSLLQPLLTTAGRSGQKI